MSLRWPTGYPPWTDRGPIYDYYASFVPSRLSKLGGVVATLLHLWRITASFQLLGCATSVLRLGEL